MTRKIKSVCVFGAASDNISQLYKNKCEELGQFLASNGYQLVFGAGASGLMGAVARGYSLGYLLAGEGCCLINTAIPKFEEAAAMANACRSPNIIGVAPDFMKEFEPIYQNCRTIIITKDMENRKKKMKAMSDAFIVVPGGIGTMDELFEILTDKQLKLHEKPILIYNINGYFDKTMDFLIRGVQEGFVSSAVLQSFEVVTGIDEIKKALA